MNPQGELTRGLRYTLAAINSSLIGDYRPVPVQELNGLRSHHFPKRKTMPAEMRGLFIAPSLKFCRM